METPSRLGKGRKSEGTSAVLRALANCRRRRVLEYLVDARGEVALEELEAVLANRRGGSRQSARIRLHHVILPQLDSCGLVEVDDDRGRVRYTGGPDVHDVLEIAMNRM